MYRVERKVCPWPSQMKLFSIYSFDLMAIRVKNLLQNELDLELEFQFFAFLKLYSTHYENDEVFFKEP